MVSNKSIVLSLAQSLIAISILFAISLAPEPALSNAPNADNTFPLQFSLKSELLADDLASKITKTRNVIIDVDRSLKGDPDDLLLLQSAKIFPFASEANSADAAHIFINMYDGITVYVFPLQEFKDHFKMMAPGPPIYLLEEALKERVFKPVDMPGGAILPMIGMHVPYESAAKIKIIATLSGSALRAVSGQSSWDRSGPIKPYSSQRYVYSAIIGGPSGKYIVTADYPVSSRLLPSPTKLGKCSNGGSRECESQVEKFNKEYMSALTKLTDDDFDVSLSSLDQRFGAILAYDAADAKRFQQVPNSTLTPTLSPMPKSTNTPTVTPPATVVKQETNVLPTKPKIELKDVATDLRPDIDKIKIGLSDPLSSLYIFNPVVSVPLSSSSTYVLRIENTGDADLKEELHYQIRVKVFDETKLINQQTFSSRDSVRSSIQYARAKQEVLGLYSFEFRAGNNPIRQGTIEIELVPEENARFASTKIIKPIVIQGDRKQDIANCFIRSAIFVSLPIAGDLHESIVGKLNEWSTVALLKCTRGDLGCLSREFLSWLGTYITEKFIALVATKGWGVAFAAIYQSYDVVANQEEYYKSLGENGCLSSASYFNYILDKLNRSGTGVSGVLTESPVYPIMRFNDGKDVGFRANGTLVDQVGGSLVKESRGKHLIMTARSDEAKVHISAYESGEMNLHSVVLVNGIRKPLSFNKVQLQANAIYSITTVGLEPVLFVGKDLNSNDKYLQAALIDFEIVPPQTNTVQVFKADQPSNPILAATLFAIIAGLSILICTGLFFALRRRR